MKGGATSSLPPAPTGLEATPDPTQIGEVKLTWNAPATLADGAEYEVTALPTHTLHKAKKAPSAKAPFRVRGLEPGASYSFEVRTVTRDGKSDPDVSDEVQVPRKRLSPLWRITSWGFVVLAGGAALVFLVPWLNGARHKDTLKCLSFACAVIFVVSGVLTITGGRFGMWRMIIGQDRRVSTSYLQTTLWTWLVAFVLAYFAARTWFNGDRGLFEGLGPGGKASSVWDDYLVLLGGPFAALVSVRGIVSAKVEGNTIQKTVADDGTASLKQALTSDDNNIDLVDSQYLIFNLVAFAYVIVALASTNRLPTIPGLLLALTGSSAATYVINKAVQSNPPAVTATIPSSVRPGERIVVEGRNFLPAGRNAIPTITIGGRPALVDATATATRLTAAVPPGVSPGAQDLVVTTAAKVATEPKTVEVLADHSA